MPELRKDIITDRWAIIATERAKRPESFSEERVQKKKSETVCPFCSGHEEMTPPEVMAYRDDKTEPDTPGWSLRVVPNKFPAFITEASYRERQVGLYKARGAPGAHEVIIHSPDHEKSLAELSYGEVTQVIRAYKDRYLELKEHPWLKDIVKYILIIVNQGKRAGASLEHPHSQLFAIPFVPPIVRTEISVGNRFYKEHKQCIFCAVLDEESNKEQRVIIDNEDFLVFCPFASFMPMEVWIVPKKHHHLFEEIDEHTQENLAETLRDTLLILFEGLNDPPYNLYLHTFPVNGKEINESYHWHLEIFPRLTIEGGFELGSGVFINVARPEEAAEFLRSIKKRLEARDLKLEARR